MADSGRRQIMKKLLSKLGSRPVILIVLTFLQLAFLFLILNFLSTWAPLFMLALSGTILFFVLNQTENPSYKLLWCALILILPLFGGALYCLFGGKKVPKSLRLLPHNSVLIRHPLLLQEIGAQDQGVLKIFRYLENCAGYGCHKNSKAVYYRSGEEKFADLVEELKQAKRFIFMEYFIIDEGVMWDTILEILKQKVKEGVDVRVIYDDCGCLYTLKKDYDKYLKSFGIKCYAFNPIKAPVSILMNNRDHRKITVIDGRAAYMGGINLADEYINAKVKYGFWKDTALKIEGEAVVNCTEMFLQLFHYCERSAEYQDEEFYRVYPSESDGYILPFADSPTDAECVGVNVHLALINHAKHYLYIQTPYLVLSYELQQALCNAAKMGVDVRIMVPAIPDKKLVFMVTRSNYRCLLEAGVRIFEFNPGFVHSKTFVLDDSLGLCQTINMDYRSYYLHFECGTLLYQSSAVLRMKEDYMKTLRSCREVSLEEVLNEKLYIKVLQAGLNLFSPLL